MNRLRASAVTAAAIVAAAVPLTFRPAAAEPPAPPAAPSVPRTIPFADQTDGRRLLLAASDAYSSGETLGYDAGWTTVRADGSGAASGAETVRLQGGRLAITTETAAAPRSVRRAVLNGDTLLATDYQPDAKPAPTRQFFRVPVEEGAPLARSLALAQFATHTKASELLLNPDWTLPENVQTLYRSRTDDSPDRAVVIEVDQPTGKDRNRMQVSRRYTLRPATHRLIRYEEWSTPLNPPAPPVPTAKGRPQRPPRGPIGTYRREDYTEVSPASITAAAFSQTLPGTYQEQAQPQVILPPLPDRPKQADPKALALLRRWKRAQDWQTSLAIDAEFVTDAQVRTADANTQRSARMDGSGTYSFWLLRPQKALRLRVKAAGGAGGGRWRDGRGGWRGGGGRSQDTLLVGDGAQARLIDYASGQSQTGPMRAGPTIQQSFRNPDLPFQDTALMWLLDGPPSPRDFDSVTLDPSAPSAVVLTRAIDGRGGARSASMVTTWRIVFGPNGLPRELTSRQEATVAGLFDRDQPPIVTTTTRLTRVSVDLEPPSGTFVLPLPPVKTK